MKKTPRLLRETRSSQEPSKPGELASQLQRVKLWQRHLETGVLEVVIVVDPLSPNFDRAVQAVEVINLAQSYYRLKIESGRFSSSASPQTIRQEIRKRFAHELLIVVVDHFLDGDVLTISEKPGCTIISSADWDGDEDPPAMRVYLVYQVVSALMSFAACLTEIELDQMQHQEDENDGPGLQGCLFDYWSGSKSLYLSMVGSRLCERCKSALSLHGTPSAAIAATEKLLEWVRSVVLGRERPLPTKVFIGHGRSKDWEVLKEFLEDWGLSVEEFNEEPVAGISITQRLKTMLERSRFAFLVMTGEDKNDEGQLQARMNVIHEIGLFQGRLGTDYAIVLRQKDAILFSNLDGINRLDYQANNIVSLKGEVLRLLIARGVLRADIEMDKSQGH